jgi:hypothetical protein
MSENTSDPAQAEADPEELLQDGQRQAGGDDEGERAATAGGEQGDD